MHGPTPKRLSWIAVEVREWVCKQHICVHYNDVIMGAIASQITSLTIVYSIVYSDADKKTSKFRVTGLCAGASPGTGEFSAKMSSNAENVSIWWRYHVCDVFPMPWTRCRIHWSQLIKRTEVNSFRDNLSKHLNNFLDMLHVLHKPQKDHD